MKPEVNAVLQEVKASLANQPVVEKATAKPTPPTPDFSTMSIMESTKWCLKNGITKPQAIHNLTGKTLQSIYTAIWKSKHPKRTKKLNQLARERKKAKAENDPALLKVKKPKISDDGLYDDGMETPWRDAIMRQGGRFNFLDEEKQPIHELVAENRRLKILVEHYETLLFKGGK